MTGKAEKKEMGWVDGKSRNVRQTEKHSNKSNSKFQLIDRPVEECGKKLEGGSLSLRSAPLMGPGTPLAEVPMSASLAGKGRTRVGHAGP